VSEANGSTLLFLDQMVLAVNGYCSRTEDRSSSFSGSQGEISYMNTTDDSVYSSGERNMSEIEKGGLLRPPDRFSVEIYFSLAYTASTKSLSN